MRESSGVKEFFDIWARMVGTTLILAIMAVSAIAAPPAGGKLGLFESQTDVGAPPKAGSAQYNPATQQYTITGGGANMWATQDSFHYVWKKMSGDLSFTAGVTFRGTGGNEHRKAGLVIRQGLGASDPYADVVVHGVGLTSLQYRSTPGGETQEIQATASAPRTIHLERHGDSFSVSVGTADGDWQYVGTIHLALHDPVYVGLAVCSHDAAVTETADFRNVELVAFEALNESESAPVESTLQVISLDGKEVRTVYKAERRFEAPNWSRDGKSLIFNMGGKLYTISPEGGEPKLLDTGSATHCNNDHSLSFDGKWLAISNTPLEDSLIYVLPSTGGEPRQITERGPSYLHGWSPDGKTLAFCGDRNGNYDVYTIPAEGGEEKRLTDFPGLDDGPDYSPDGNYIYFNSVRTGYMQIWRMHPDGSHQERITRDGYADWFAHPSPDAKWLVFVSYDKTVQGHPPNHHVMLRVMSTEGGTPRILRKLFGGQGTMNVPSWSPDSKHLAFVSYRLLKK
jgi:TolB protein